MLHMFTILGMASRFMHTLRPRRSSSSPKIMLPARAPRPISEPTQEVSVTVIGVFSGVSSEPRKANDGANQPTPMPCCKVRMCTSHVDIQRGLGFDYTAAPYEAHLSWWLSPASDNAH